VRLAELGVPVYEARHEATAMAMADGYARSTGKVAICSVTAGPGLAHTFVPLWSASRRTPSPVVVLTGPHSRDDIGGRQALDHEGLVRMSGVHYRPLGAAGIAVERSRAVIDLARSTGRPVVFDVPLDVQDQDYPWEFEPRPTPQWHQSQTMAPDPVQVAAAADLLRAAQRPVVVAGGGAASVAARDELAALAEACGALVATSTNARGLFYGDRFNAGVAGLFSNPASTAQFAEADCVVAFGASLNNHTTVGGYLWPAARFVRVDTAPPEPMENGQAADCYVRGDAIATARALREQLGSPSGPGYRTDAVAEALRAEVDETSFEIEPGRVDPRELCARLDELLPDDCGLVSGAAHYWSFPQMHMPRWREPLLYSSYSGSIGYSVSVALGASLATSRPIVVFEGDGGLMMNPHVLDSVARSGARLLVVLMNDHALGAEFHKLRAKGLDPSLAVHPELDLAAMATLMGCRSAVVTDVGQLEGLVKEFVAGDGPMVLDARVSRNVVSQPYRRSYFGIG
jgi:thiamine pyrophosphate-dependent acetolactate synthase large subunit-like protein